MTSLQPVDNPSRIPYVGPMSTNVANHPVGTRVRVTTGLKSFGLVGTVVRHTTAPHGTSTHRLGLKAHTLENDVNGTFGPFDPRELEVVG